MSNWPSTVRYVERLSLDNNDQPITIHVTIPQSRDDAFDLISTLDRLSREDSNQWKAAVRMYTATSWYVMGLFMSGAQRLDPITGRPEMDCDFLFNSYMEMQFDGDNCLNTSARGHHKSHVRNYVGATVVIVNDPNEIIGLVAHEKAAAAKHGIRTGLEWEKNVELKTAWDDVFFWDPKRDPQCPLWNQETGFTVKRTITATLPSLSWHGIEEVPTGSRISLFIFDDLENEKTVESDDQRKKVLDRFASFQELAGRIPRVWINGTYHHPNGLVAHLAKSQAYKVVCHAAEDVNLPAPDIAALYDACGGRLPTADDTKKVDLPIGVRDMRLDGAATFLHPLELAHKRLRAMSMPGGLANYYRQNMGDPLAGEDKRFRPDWIRRYDVPPEDAADGAYIYIVVDASKGVNDPTFARVEACRSDKSIAWVGGLRKRIAPSDFGREIWLLCCQWEGIGVLKEVRFEIFGQAAWDTLFMQYCEQRRHWPGGIGPHNVKAIGRNKVNRTREWLALEPLYRSGKRVYPAEGVLMVEDENKQRLDLVKYYLENEYEKFPLPITDDGLAADALLGEPVDIKKGIYALEFPETDMEYSMRENSEWRRGRKYAVSGARSIDSDGDHSWMEEGL